MNANDPHRRPGAKPAANHTPGARAGSAHYGAHREGEVFSTTEARQASPKTMNMRVLVASMLILAVLGFALTAAFWGSAPEDGGTVTGPAATVQPQQAPEASSAAPAAPAPDAAPQQQDGTGAPAGAPQQPAQ